MKSYLNEIFGPVLQIIEIDNIEEGFRLLIKILLEMVVVFLQKMEVMLENFLKK